MWTGLSPIGSNIGRAFFLSVLFDTAIYPWYSIKITKEKTMTDQTRWGIDLIQQENKAKTYDRKNSINLHQAQDIYKQSSGLDNISEFDMKRFREIMLGAR